MNKFTQKFKRKIHTTMEKYSETKSLKGLTLVEILVVILIIGVLIAALVPRVSAATDKAKETQVKTDFRVFSMAAESVMREYSGFAGVPLMAKDGSVLSTIGAESWADGKELSETPEIPTSESLIKAINRYLESSYQFGDDVTEDGLNFGRSNAKDPWGQSYEVFFVARNKDAATNEALSSDRIYITSAGKTKNEKFADYTLMIQYKKGEVRTAMVGFDGETYTEDTDYVTGKNNDNFYVCVQDLFKAKHGTVADKYFDVTNAESLFDGSGTPGNGMGGSTPNVNRTYVANSAAAGDEAGAPTVLPATDAQANRG